MNHRMILPILLSCLTVLIISGCSSKDTSSTPVKTITQKVKRDNLEVGLAADGQIDLSLINLNFQDSGVVKEIMVKVGQSVKEGEILAKLDDTDVQLSITKAQNALSKAKSNYTNAVNQHEINIFEAKMKLDESESKLNAQPDNDSLKSIYELNLKKYENIKNDDTNVQNAKLNIEEAENQVAEAKNNLDKLNLKAPSSGKIMNIAYKVGESVNGTKSTSSSSIAETNSDTPTNSSSTSFMTMYDPSIIYVTANVSENDISGIKPDQDVRVTIDALSLQNLEGKVDTVSEEPTVDSSGIVTYKVTEKLTEQNENIKDGMTALLTFLKKEKKDVLVIPNKAIFVENGKQYVNVKTSDKKNKKREITGGLTNGVETEVVTGLKEGEFVVIGGANN